MPDSAVTRGFTRGALTALLVALVAAGAVVLLVVLLDGNRDEVPVVVPPELAARLPDFDELDRVRVTGEVDRLDANDLDTGGTRTQTDLSDFDGQSGIIATEVEVLGEGDADGQAAGPSLQDLIDDDGELVGRRVTVTGSVDDRLGVLAFTLTD